MSQDNTTFVTSRGSLEIRFFNASHTDNAVKLAVFAHPWAPLGGSMHDPVLSLIRRVFSNRGFNILVYNSRFSFTGLPEVRDFQELVQGTIMKLGRVDVLYLLGYSYGSLIASLHPLWPFPSKTFHILLSYPLSVRGLLTLFNGSTYDFGLRQLLCETSSNVLVLYGDRDQFTSFQKYEEWISGLKNTSKGQFLTHMIHNADHFWRDSSGEQLCLFISHWLDETAP